MSKIIYNETDTMVQFNNECSHKIWLYPKGSLDPKHPDHAEISMAESKHPNIVQFREAGKISVLSLEQAHARENPPVAPAAIVEQKSVVETPAPVVEAKPVPVAEPAPVAEVATEPAAEETVEEEADDSADKSQGKRGKGKRNR
jgi:hypothetical protein